MRSIAQTLNEGPVAIYDVTDDPRIQYPKEAAKEGIASILSVPIVAGGETIGAPQSIGSVRWRMLILYRHWLTWPVWPSTWPGTTKDSKAASMY